MIKQDIVHHVIERTGLPRTKAEAAVDTVFEGLKQALAAGERIELRGFGVFSVRARKTGIGRNPRTGTEVSITPGKAVRFKPGKELHALDQRQPERDSRLRRAGHLVCRLHGRPRLGPPNRTLGPQALRLTS